MAYEDDHNSATDAELFPKQLRNIIVDLGDVLITWSVSSASLSTTMSPSLLREMLRSPPWHEYEKGNLTELDVYETLATKYSVPADDIRDAIGNARKSLQGDNAMIQTIRKLKDIGLNVYLMSNISKPDFTHLQGCELGIDWSLFDGIFLSAEAGLRKPEIGFYKHVLSTLDISPSSAVFIDDKFENVFSAKSVGIHGILHSHSEETIRQLSWLFLNPFSRGKLWLEGNKGKMMSITSSGHVVKENFSQLLIIEATGDESLTMPINITGQSNFFNGAALFTTDLFPNDLDTTSIGLCSPLSQLDSHIAHGIMDEMLSCCNKDGIIQVYFDHQRPRLDPIVCVNVLTLFYRFGRGHELTRTLVWVKDVLLNRAYIDGTLYYTTAEAFLFFLARLIKFSAKVRQELGPLFEDRLKERFNQPGDALTLAMRLLAAVYLDPGFCSKLARVDAFRLRKMQKNDGSWEGGWFYKYGSSNIAIQNQGLTTALALKALHAYFEN